jgi:hypothetical protein
VSAGGPEPATAADDCVCGLANKIESAAAEASQQAEPAGQLASRAAAASQQQPGPAGARQDSSIQQQPASRLCESAAHAAVIGACGRPASASPAPEPATVQRPVLSLLQQS